MLRNGLCKIKMKTILLIVLCLLSITYSDLTWSTSVPMKISINDENVEFNDQTGFPFIDESSRTQVPIRGVLTAYGAEVYWNTQNKEVVVEYERDIIVVPINKNYIKKNGEKIQIDTQAIIRDNRSYIPIKWVIEALGGEVQWDSMTKTVEIQRPISGDIINDINVADNADENFQGFFINPDYNDPSVFLKTGSQTEITDKIRVVSSTIPKTKDISALREIFQIINELPRVTIGAKQTATADEVFSQGSNGCTNNAVLFAALAKDNGIPTIIVNSAYVPWIKNIQSDPNYSRIEGHFFVEVFLSDNKWYLVDSTNGTLFLNYDPNNFSITSGGRDYYIYAKSIEVTDIGIKDDRDIGTIQIKCFEDFDTLKFESPIYNTMILY